MLLASGLRHDLGRKVDLFFFDPFTDFIANEPNHLGALLGNQLADGLIRIFDEGLLDQANLLQELTDTPYHHLLNDLGRFT